MSSSWGGSWGISWGDSWGPLVVAPAHTIVGAGGIASEESFGIPGILIGGRVHIIVGAPPPMPEIDRYKTTAMLWGVGNIWSEEAFGTPTISENQNELALLLLAA